MEDIVLATLKGKPIITVKSLEKEKQDFLDWAPQFNIPFYIEWPDFDYRTLQDVIDYEIADEYVRINGLNQSDEYQKELKEQVGFSLRTFNYRFLLNQYAPIVTENDMIEYMISMGIDDKEIEKHMHSFKDRMDESQIYRKIKNDKKMKLLKETLAGLRKEYNVQVNEEYFRNKKN